MDELWTYTKSKRTCCWGEGCINLTTVGGRARCFGVYKLIHWKNVAPNTSDSPRSHFEKEVWPEEVCVTPTRSNK
ncbi:hypothetical protein OUZ56_021096 [Daphnia magna]|uniref:Uncharacterized protein n=1 Tax=Daphnia magna TaxID=35525 RepID=A0ABQ9ZHV3_9CRUS|nr:hypothetical protein OUZ56_021096 [Daphnia magna]